MSEASLKKITIDTYAEQIERRIARAAAHGRKEIANPFSSLDDEVGAVTYDLPKEQLDILIEHFRDLGYDVEVRAPTETSYMAREMITIKW